jgi:hypothetical protein
MSDKSKLASPHPTVAVDSLPDEVESHDAADEIESSDAAAEATPVGSDQRRGLGVLKSQSYPVVPNLRIINGEPVFDSEAPYGRDENNRPIHPPVSDVERAVHLGKRPDLAPGNCPHKNDPANCVLCGTKDIPKLEPETPDRAAQEQALLEWNLKKQLFPPEQTTQHVLECPKPPWWDRPEERERYLGTPEERAWEARCAAVEKENVRRLNEWRKRQNGNQGFTFLRDVFWDRAYRKCSGRAIAEQIISWLDRPDPDSIVTYVDNPEYEERPTKVFPDLERQIADARIRIKDLTEQKKQFQAEHDGFSAKLRGDLDAKTRAKYKREAKTARKKCETDIRQERGNILNWQKETVRLKTEPTAFEKVPVPGTGTVVSSQPTTFQEYLTGKGSISQSDLDRYVSFAAGNTPPFKGMGAFENRLIHEAIKFGVILAPLKCAQTMAPWLSEFSLDRWNRDDELENRLILKTGGEQIGGRIYGAGQGRAGYGRRLTTFDKTEYGSASSGPDVDSGSWGGDVDSGDSE